jgi:hypothetical protein
MQPQMAHCTGFLRYVVTGALPVRVDVDQHVDGRDGFEPVILVPV